MGTLALLVAVVLGIGAILKVRSQDITMGFTLGVLAFVCVLLSYQFG